MNCQSYEFKIYSFIYLTYDNFYDLSTINLKNTIILIKPNIVETFFVTLH